MHTARDVYRFLDAARQHGEDLFRPRAALATLTRSFGSTFRRPGSRMLVGGGGQVIRGLSGGCPEADIVTQAREVIASGQSRLVRYDRDYGMDALLELGCGGGLEVQIEPVADRAGLAFLDEIAAAWAARRSGFLATLVASGGQCLQPAPRRLLWLDGARIDQLGTLYNRAAVADLARRALAQAPVAHVDAVLGGSACTWLFEAIRPQVQLLIVGANAVADAVARLARWLEWSVVQVDPRDKPAGDGPPQKDSADGVTRLHGGPGQVAGMAAFDAGTYALVMNYRLELDVEFAAALLRTPLAYLGMLGSRKRSQAVFERLLPEFGEGGLAGRLYTPAGLDIGSEDPEEIAVSLVAQIRAVAAGKSGGHLHASVQPIHLQRAVEFSGAASGLGGT
ncbi:MAG: XdhC family protein [Nevskia sp.]|nr:XdhC family protein [Nevskia sp.]